MPQQSSLDSRYLKSKGVHEAEQLSRSNLVKNIFYICLDKLILSRKTNVKCFLFGFCIRPRLSKTMETLFRKTLTSGFLKRMDIPRFMKGLVKSMTFSLTNKCIKKSFHHNVIFSEKFGEVNDIFPEQ